MAPLIHTGKFPARLNPVAADPWAAVAFYRISAAPTWKFPSHLQRAATGSILGSGQRHRGGRRDVPPSWEAASSLTGHFPRRHRHST